MAAFENRHADVVGLFAEMNRLWPEVRIHEWFGKMRGNGFEFRHHVDVVLRDAGLRQDKSIESIERLGDRHGACMSVMNACGDFNARDGIVRLEIREGGAVDGGCFRRSVDLRITAASRFDVIVVAVFTESAFGMPRLDVGNAAPCGRSFP